MYLYFYGWLSARLAIYLYGRLSAWLAMHSICISMAGYLLGWISLKAILHHSPPCRMINITEELNRIQN
jgi:hypothetical protein